MKITLPGFTMTTTNVYRTKNFIVKQYIGIMYDSEENNAVYSYDTYYERTDKRDKEYEQVFSKRKNVNGKRLPTMMYTREYVYK